MNVHWTMAALAFALATTTGISLAEEKLEQKSEDEWKYEYKDGVREVKRERKPGGEWKYEYKDEYCEVKRERTSSGEYKEEVKCK